MLFWIEGPALGAEGVGLRVGALMIRIGSWWDVFWYACIAQYPLIKEYSLNHNMKPYIIFQPYSFIKGYWALWEGL